MYDIHLDEFTKEFAECFNAAGLHLQNQVVGGINYWLKAGLHPPFLEHLSFRLGNQLFFIRINDADRLLSVPGTLNGLLHIAHENNGYPCILQMRKQAGIWKAIEPGWGLRHAETTQPIDPVALITDEKIILTDWEIHDFAVQVVRNSLKNHEIMSFTSDPGIKPSIWFMGDDGPEWVIVKGLRYPSTSFQLPTNIDETKEKCSSLSTKGHYGVVGIASTEQREEGKELPLYRGYPAKIDFKGLHPL